jgi:hypothetical protein
MEDRILSSAQEPQQADGQLDRELDDLDVSDDADHVTGGRLVLGDPDEGGQVV